MKKVLAAILLAAAAAAVPAQTRVSVTGTLDWAKAEIRASGSLNLASAGLRLPVGRLQAEEMLNAEYPQILRSFLLSLLVDSSTTLQDAIESGGYSLLALDRLIIQASSSAPSLSPDFLSLTGRCVISLDSLSAELSGHSRPAGLPETLETPPAADYTSIIIIATEELPRWGRNTRAKARPCVFPKIWDTEMNLIYDKNTGSPENKTRFVRYVRQEDILRPTPSGLDGDLAAFGGERPLRIIARQLFGEHPTDPVIDRASALQILATERNRQLLRDHKVIIVLPPDTLISSLQ